MSSAESAVEALASTAEYLQVATGMLDALLGESSAGRFDMAVLAPFPGPETKAYCRSWDAFTGNTTPGIDE